MKPRVKINLVEEVHFGAVLVFFVLTLFNA